MFGFMKKHSEKDREEREQRKKREKEEKELKRSGKSLTPDELGRLEEAKKAMQKKSTKEDETGNDGFERSLSQSGSVKSRTAAADVGMKSSVRVSAPPPIFPKPKKGILKDKSSYGQAVPNQGVRGNVDDTVTVEENTFANEILSVASGTANSALTTPVIAVTESNESAERNPAVGVQKVPSQRRAKPVVSVKRTSSKLSSSPSPLSVTSAARPPSPIEKCYNDVDLQLPDVAPPSCPQPRELTLRRQAAGDFGFTLRKGVVLERIGAGDNPDERQRTVIFAEPGPKLSLSGGGDGLLPGDRLVEVNGVNVENLTREAIIELIRKSGDTVKLLVQPIPELSELSMRSAALDSSRSADVGSVDGQTVSGHGSSDTRTSGSLQRSGSMKYRAGLVCIHI